MTEDSAIVANAVRLGLVLGKYDLTQDQYLNWLGTDQGIYEKFNVVRFEKHMQNLHNLDEGYYWVKYTSDEWEIAQYRDGEFDTFDQNGISLYEMTDIDINRIVRGEDES